MKFPKESKIFNDLGFGTRNTSPEARFINKDGSFNITRSGRNKWHLYQILIEMGWPRFILVSILFFLGINVFFAVGFWLIGVDKLSIQNGLTEGEKFLESLYYSIQTFTTVGYGRLHPEGHGANILSSICALTGWMALALMTGLFFARFSRPRPQILLSENAVIAPYGDITSLQFRIANGRHHRIYDLEAVVTMTWLEEHNGKIKRRFANLSLERSRLQLFPLNWTVVHPIDADSPLWEKDQLDLENVRAEFLILIKGFDESFTQLVHSTYSYKYNELRWNHTFDMMYTYEENQGTRLFLDRLNKTHSIEKI